MVGNGFCSLSHRPFLSTWVHSPMNQNSPHDSEIPRAGLYLVPPATDGIATPPAASIAQQSRHASHGISLTPSILFATDSDELDSAAAGNLDRLAAFLEMHRTRTGLIEGYTDNAGVDSGNQDLSLRRAESVHSYLVSHGIDASRLTSVGRGSAYPVASNESFLGRKQNRRVEVLLSNDCGSANRAAITPPEQASSTQPAGCAPVTAGPREGRMPATCRFPF